MKLSDIIVPILLVLIIMSIIVPMPLGLVDFALSVNIALSLLILTSNQINQTYNIIKTRV